MTRLSFIYLLILLGTVHSVQSFGQEYIDSYEQEPYQNAAFSQSESHKSYLNSDQEVVEFDEDQWQIIKRSIAEGMTEDYYELSDSVGFVLEDSDNPYKQTRRSYRKHWRDKNAHRAKRLPQKEKEQTRLNIPDVDLPQSKALSTLMIVVVVVALAVLIFFLFFNSPINNKNKKIRQDLGNVIPTEIPKTELELMLEQALERKDYREAIRVYFIFIIRGLIVKEWIEWEKEKTNFSYLMEMRDKPLSKEFESTVSVYEIVWYGKREITREEYEVLEPRFKSLTKKLDQ
ncbi:MAG: hypothetical protein ABF242_10665 [Flavobacteriales bacterium]